MKGQTGIVAAPLYHMNGLLFLLSLVAGGGTAILMSRFQAQEYLSAIDRYKVTLLTGVPTMLALCLKEQEMVSALDLTSVRSIQIGSAPLSEALLGPVEQMFPNASIFNAYGTTEVGAGIFGPHPDKIPIPKVALGYPRPHVKVRLVGGATPSEGVLEVKTEAAMSGYLNLPDKTAEKISDGWINTGDVMRIDENGFYFFVGRNDDMFVCGGENVYPGQVERILEKDERIHEVCVVARPDEVKGQLPIAFIVKAPQVTISEDDVKQLALEKAPAYMHPREVVFIESMPLAGTNKIDRKVLELRATDRKYKGDIQCVAAILGQQQSVYVIGCES
jgi:acyl-CoA synthetase (AMP-forming)/AMP-acid ligase II